MKVHTVCDETRERLLKVLGEMATAAIGIDVVAGRYHQIQRHSLVDCEHLLRSSDLVVLAGAEVPDDRESQGVLDRRTEDREWLCQGYAGDCGQCNRGLTSCDQAALLLAHF